MTVEERGFKTWDAINDPDLSGEQREAIIEQAIIAAEEESTKKERDRCIELVRRCYKAYEREANREREAARAKGLQPSKIDDYEEIFVYHTDLEKRLCEKATACEYVEMVIKEWSLDSNLMPLPF